MDITLENIVPLKNFIIIKTPEKLAETTSGFIIPEETHSNVPIAGEVIKAGEDSKFKIGQTVFFRRYSVDELKFNDNSGKQTVVSLISDDEVVATLKDA